MRRLLILACAIVFLDTMFFAAVAPLLPQLSDELDLSKTAAGVLTGAYAAGALAGSVPGGLLAARWGVRPTVVAGVTTFSVSVLVFALADEVWLLDTARFVQGVGSAAAWAGALSWLVGGTPRGRRGEMLGTAMAAAVAGALFGPVLGGAAAELGRDAVFGSVAILGAAIIVSALRMPAFPPSRDVSLSALRGALRERRIVAAIALILLPGAIGGSIAVLVPLRLDELGASATAIAAAFLVAALIEAAVSPVAGRVSDRRGRVVPALAGLGAAAVMLPLLALPGQALPLALLLVLVAPLVGVLWSPAMALLSDAAESIGLDQALAFALVNLGWGLGQIAGAAGGGRLGEVAGDAWTYVLLSAASATMFLVLWRFRPREPRRA